MKPDTFRLEIYKESTPWVRKLFTNPYDSLSISKIKRLNKVITKRNMKDGLQEGEFLISINVLRAIGIAAKWAAGSLRLRDKGREAVGNDDPNKRIPTRVASFAAVDRKIKDNFA
jgi:hypothetical protein